MSIYLNNQLVEFIQFPNQEKRLDLNHKHLKDSNVAIWRYQGDTSIFELLLFNHTMSQLKRSYELYIPYMPYSRMDRVEDVTTAFSLDLLTDLLAQMKPVKMFHILDPHSPVTLQLLKEKGAPAQEWSFSLAHHVLKDTNKDWVVFPDKGAALRYNESDYPNVIINEKHRHFKTGRIEKITAHIEKETSLSETPDLFIIDDISSYGGTFVGALEAIKSSDIPYHTASLIITHAEDVIGKGKLFEHFDHIYTTDSLISENAVAELKQTGQLTVIPLNTLVFNS